MHQFGPKSYRGFREVLIADLNPSCKIMNVKCFPFLIFLQEHSQIGDQRLNKAVATASVACGWAGAVMWGAGAVGGAVYTRASVTCDWAGAVMRKPLAE